MKTQIVIFGLLLSCSIVTAQDAMRGVILSEKGKPVRRMNVWVKNSLDGIKTGKQGEFILYGLNEKDTLIISVSKKQDAVIPIKDRGDSIIITLKKDEFLLKDNSREFMFPYSKKTLLAFNPNILTRTQIEQSGANSLYDLLRGNLPGVTVSESNGNTLVTIRGGSSFDLNNEPLFIIDGVEYRNSYDADRSVNINDIEQLEVQSDGAMYGIKGSNGAIVITTKKK
ncbi:MAG: TonB-dependent receptor plug domain-containing protein [Porphyromonadaceae bacterium]|nr:TonB-dependent receptor plug domain-containing protein [Porphyromonadaceae bacterium]